MWKCCENSRCYLEARGFGKCLLCVPVTGDTFLGTRGSFRIQGKDEPVMSLLESLRPLWGILQKMFGFYKYPLRVFFLFKKKYHIKVFKSKYEHSSLWHRFFHPLSNGIHSSDFLGGKFSLWEILVFRIHLKEGEEEKVDNFPEGLRKKVLFH